MGFFFLQFIKVYYFYLIERQLQKAKRYKESDFFFSSNSSHQMAVMVQHIRSLALSPGLPAAGRVQRPRAFLVGCHHVRGHMGAVGRSPVLFGDCQSHRWWLSHSACRLIFCSVMCKAKILVINDRLDHIFRMND